MTKSKNHLEKIIIYSAVILFIALMLVSSIYEFVKKPEPSEFSFETCVEKYIFVYEDLCDKGQSFYITYPEKEIVKGELDKIYLDDYTYIVYSERCIQYYKTGCLEDSQKNS